MSTRVRAQGCPSQRVPKGAAKAAKEFLKKQKIKCHRCPCALGTVPVEMHISMAIMPAASLRLLLFSLCGDAMGRSASAMKVRGASQSAFQKVRMKIRGAAQPAAKAKAKVKNRPDAMDIDQSAKGQPFGEDVKERIRRTTRVPSCAKGLKESSSASGSAGASQPDDGDDEEDDVDDGDEEQSLATRTTREKKAAYQVAAEAREARLLKFAMDEARKAEVASRAAEAKRRKHEHSLGRFTRCSSGHGPGVRIFAANPE